MFAKIDDAIRLSKKRPQFIGFLDEAEVFKASSYLKSKNAGYVFWGGHNEAERKILAFYPDYIVPEKLDYPISAISFLYRKGEELNHRNFLGSFMSLGLTRSSIGDILIEDGRCVAFIKREHEALFLQDLSKIGRVGVKVSAGFELPLPVAHNFENLKGVVASVRLDCIVAFLMRTSREKACEAVRQGLVSVNHNEVSSVSDKLKTGDIISIRKKGRFVLDDCGPLTSKGRLVINARKYI